ncbi:MAG: phosphoenolpyruvate carboxykinase (ATP), partial [Pseudomonadota bacterium]
PAEYGRLLGDLIDRHGVKCWLVNTGWSGGPYGVGDRMPIKATRALLSAALSGALDAAPMATHPIFGLAYPTQADGLDAAILDPRATWRSGEDYDAQARKLAQMFIDNFEVFAPFVDDAVRGAGPTL